MAKISKHIRLSQQHLNWLAKIQAHYDDRKQVAADLQGIAYKKASETEAVEFAIKYAYDNLQKEGYIR